MYVAGGEHPHRPTARAFLERAQKGDFEICTSTEVLQEILYRYTALGKPTLAREVYDLFVELCPEVLPVTLADTDVARDLLGQVGGISARDAIHAAVVLNQRIEGVATFDEGFDAIPGIQRFPLTQRKRPR